MFNRENTSIISVTKIDKLMYNTERHYIGRNNLYFALYGYGLNGKILENKSYVDVKVYQVTNTRQYPSAISPITSQKTELPLILC